MEKAVHTKTQEQWDIVTKHYGYYWKHLEWRDQKENTGINTQYKSSSTASFYQDTENFTLISFEEWSKEVGLTSDVNRGTLEEMWDKLEVGMEVETNYNFRRDLVKHKCASETTVRGVIGKKDLKKIHIYHSNNKLSGRGDSDVPEYKYSWGVSKHADNPEGYIQLINKSIIKTSNYGKEKESVKVQRPNLKIGRGSSKGGFGLKGTTSKIRLGGNDRHYQERLS